MLLCYLLEVTEVTDMNEMTLGFKWAEASNGLVVYSVYGHISGKPIVIFT